MDSENAAEVRPSRGVGVTSFFAVAIGYPLSLGPALALTNPATPSTWMELLYGPLLKAYVNVPAVQVFYDWYIPLWYYPG
jgi:ABC-type phosphate transport system permease subunit